MNKKSTHKLGKIYRAKREISKQQIGKKKDWHSHTGKQG